MDSAWYDLDCVFPDVWRINDGGMDTSYIRIGKERAAVIDTGMGIGDLGALVAHVTGASPVVVNTHAHPDHWQGNFQFEETCMSSQEWNWVCSWEGNDPHIATVLDDMPTKRSYPPTFDRKAWPHRQPEPTRLLADGDIVDLGGAQLEVVMIPGHTPGGLALLDRDMRLLFVGDTVQHRRIWLQLAESADLDTIGATYQRLGDLADQVDHILPGHGNAVLPGEFLRELADGMQRVLEGNVSGQWEDTFAGGGWYYDLGGYGPLLKREP